MNRSKSILRDTFIYSVGNFGSKILSFLLLPLYTFFLSKANLGSYDLLITTINLFVPLITMQISDAIYRWLLDAKEDNNLKRAAISSGFFVVSFSLIIFSSIYYAVSFFVEFNNSLYFVLILITSCYLPFFQQIIRGLGKNKFYSLIGILSSLFVLVFNVIFLYFLKLGINGLFLTLIISNGLLIVIIFYFGKLYQFVSPKKILKSEIKSMLKYSWPLILNIMAWWIINASDKYIILYYLGKDENGLYAVATRFPAIILLFNSVFLMSFQDYALKSDRTEDDIKFMSNLFNKFLRLELCFVLLMIVVSPFLVKYLIDVDYQETWKYMPFLYIGVAFSALSAFVGLGYQIKKDTVGVNTTTLIGAAVNIMISLLFIRKIGLYAPAIGTFVSFLVVYLIRLKHTKESLPIRVEFWVQNTLIIIILVTTYLIHFENLILNIACVLFSLVIGWFFNKSTILRIGSMILKR